MKQIISLIGICSLCLGLNIHFSADKTVEKPDDTEEKSDNEIAISHKHTHIRDEPSTDGKIVYYASKGETFAVQSDKDNWFEVENEETDGFIHKRLLDDSSINERVGLENKTVVLDAGHGGRDVGAISESGDYEKKFTYSTTQELERELERLGANVILTRDVDDFVPLGGRTSLANIADTDAFISIHYNNTPELPEVTGIGTYYYYDQDKALARSVQSAVIQITDADDRGVSFENLHVTRQTLKPSILIELGFLSNAEEEHLLKQRPYQKKIVSGIIQGLQEYFSE